MTDEPLIMVPGPPDPDPSVLTTQSLQRSMREREELVGAQLAVRDARISGSTELVLAKVKALDVAIATRLDGMDKANVVLAENVNRVPTNLQSAIAQLKELENVKFAAIQSQFEERDKQSVRESAANTLAVNAAFAAQKESAAATDKANAEAIRKSEAATAETISKLEQLVAGQIVSLNDKVEDGKASNNSLRIELTASINLLRTELIQFQSRTIGGHDQRSDSRSSQNLMLGVVGAIVAVLVLGLALYGALKP